jgi:CBS domain-containing protein
MQTSVMTVSHYGVVRFGDMECEAVVLTGGERGYVRKQLANLLGFDEGHKGGRFLRFLGDFVPKSAPALEKSRGPILLPSGRQSQFFPAGIIADLATAVVEAAIHGRLHKARQGIVPNCLKIMRALATTGEVALIDEATGTMTGLFTDGDLRRLILRNPADLARPISEVMTRTPRTLRDTAIVDDAVKMFREHRQDEIPVVDAAGKPVGILDVQDLMAMKLVKD